MFRSVAFAVAFVLGAAGVATAQTADDQEACKDDAFRVCSSTIPDRERTFQCLLVNKDAISPACRTVLARFLPPDPVPQKAATRRARKGPINLKASSR